MLRAALVCAAILITAILAGTLKAQAQAQTPFPGYGPLYGNGTIQGGLDYNDWQQTRRDHGLDYDQSIDQRRDTYQPYPSVTPSYGSDPYRSRSPYSSSGGDDD
jgi:glucan phosphorylase